LIDTSIVIRKGDRVGLVGRNGAGKSSFLRVAAGVYLPQSGTVTVEGQVQALFDIGVGFEAHATGRENIFYRGLVMGQRPHEIRARVDEIIAFADIGEFIDMPLRSYSAGMGVRLAFAISTFLEGDVLLIDEVFGAGDLAFYTKAKNRMLQLVDQAGIVCFASHDLVTIRDICNRVIWLQGGRVVADGSPIDVTKDYERAVVSGVV
jgi:lipopolysaccharide transport system ATP-binding protein